MGQLERELQAEVRRSKIARAIVTTVAVSGGIALAALAPNVIGAIAGLYARQTRYRLKSALSRLIARGYVVLEVKKGKRRIRLTKKGEQCAVLILLMKI